MTFSPPSVIAVDLGASSGRVMLGRAGGQLLEMVEVHRFANRPVRLPDGLHWDVVGLFREVLTGLRAAVTRSGELGWPAPSSVAVDSWAVDYGLLDDSGALLSTPFHYRDERTAAGVARVDQVIGRAELYGVNGLQFLPFNTLYQLAAEPARRLAATGSVLMIPDLIAFWLTGVRGAELTNASTTGLLDVRTRQWSAELIERLGSVFELPAGALPPLRAPGETIGPLLAHVQEETGLGAEVVLVAAASHDTASSVLAVPAAGGPGRSFAYIASGTWSLVGMELSEPVLSEASRAANFSNEGGVGGTVRYLRNVMGLWILQECLREWSRDAPAETLPLLPELLEQAAALPEGGPVIDPDDPIFLPPGGMPDRLLEACRAAGQPVPQNRPELVRCILDSLANAYARAVADAVRLTGTPVDVVHVVGGGSQNELLCRLTARACGLPVLAGPVEATALGNVLIQARANGSVSGGIDEVRELVRLTQPLLSYPPDLG